MKLLKKAAWDWHTKLKKNGSLDGLTLEEYKLIKMVCSQDSNLLDILVTDYIDPDMVPAYAKALDKYQVTEFLLDLNETHWLSPKKHRNAVLEAFKKEGFTEKEKVHYRKAHVQDIRGVILVKEKK